MRKVLKVLFSPSLALASLICFAFSMAAATFVENDFGTQTARVLIYNAFWFELLMVLLAISFLGNIYNYRLYERKKWPILLFHIAFLVILLGAAITRYTGFEGVMRIREGQSSDIIISDRNYLQIAVESGSDRQEIEKEMYFSPVKKNDFTIQSKVGDSELVIRHKDFIPDASLKLTKDEKNGVPVLELVVAAGNGRESILLKKGHVTELGLHKHTISFMAEEPGDVNILTRNDSLLIQTRQALDIFFMETQTGAKIEAGGQGKLEFNALHRFNDVSFVPVNFEERGALKWASKARKPKDNSDTLDDIVLLEVECGNELQEIELTYRHGYLPEFKKLEINGLKVSLGFGSLPLSTGFKVKLRDFILERYPGSTSPSAYTSEVTVQDGQKEIDYSIYMNHVLDYRGYRFFQASYDSDEQGTVLSVNHDRAGTLVSYIGYLMMGLGMFLTLFWRGSRFRKVNAKLSALKGKQLTVAWLAFFCIASSPSAFSQLPGAATDDDQKAAEELVIVPEEIAESFGRLMVQDLDGRIKPINTLASEFLRKVSRKTYYKLGEERLSPDQVFLSLHMSPNAWRSMPLIAHDKKKLGPDLEQISQIENKLLSFSDFLDDREDYLLENQVMTANKKKPAMRSEFDNEIIRVDERFNIVFNVMSGNYLNIFPKKDDLTYTWFDPNHNFADFNEEDSRFCRSILSIYFAGLEKGLKTGDWTDANESLSYIAKYQQVLAQDLMPDDQRIEAELWYNQLNLNFWLFQAYFTLGFLLLILSVIKVFRTDKTLRLLSVFLIAMCVIFFAAHTFNLVLRWYIAGYPPWSNGYEMIVFVAWSLMLFGFLFFRRSDFVLPLASIFSGTLLFVSYLDWLNPEITNLMPVLKSYWLKIHVAIIISSYAPLALSALLGLMSLVLMLVVKASNKARIEPRIRELTYINEMSMTIGLFLLSVGTFLGGVWANESWGRYWAWDPKETWALISIIIYAIVLHLRMVPGLNNRFVLNAASVYAFYSIIMTSFGVNYYLTGLHSYATGDPVPIPVFVYVTVTLILILTVGSGLRYKREN